MGPNNFHTEGLDVKVSLMFMTKACEQDYWFLTLLYPSNLQSISLQTEINGSMPKLRELDWLETKLPMTVLNGQDCGSWDNAFIQTVWNHVLGSYPPESFDDMCSHYSLSWSMKRNKLVSLGILISSWTNHRKQNVRQCMHWSGMEAGRDFPYEWVL